MLTRASPGIPRRGPEDTRGLCSPPRRSPEIEERDRRRGGDLNRARPGRARPSAPRRFVPAREIHLDPVAGRVIGLDRPRRRRVGRQPVPDVGHRVPVGPRIRLHADRRPCRRSGSSRSTPPASARIDSSTTVARRARADTGVLEGMEPGRSIPMVASSIRCPSSRPAPVAEHRHRLDPVQRPGTTSRSSSASRKRAGRACRPSSSPDPTEATKGLPRP